MLGAVKLHDEVVTVMNLYTLNAIISKTRFLKITHARKHIDRKPLGFIK